mgnify:CR=1 FL=1
MVDIHVDISLLSAVRTDVISDALNNIGGVRCVSSNNNQWRTIVANQGGENNLRNLFLRLTRMGFNDVSLEYVKDGAFIFLILKYNGHQSHSGFIELQSAIIEYASVFNPCRDTHKNHGCLG